MKARAAAFVLLCAWPGCVLFADKTDYADYRAVRLASDERQRLLAMQRYVARHPDGDWHAEVQAERKRHDVASFEAGKATEGGLRDYLAAFPEGVFASQARARLSVIAVLRARAAEQHERDRQLARQRQQRELELRRTWVTRFVAHWIATLGELRAWGAPLPEVAQANPRFSRAFGAEPRPRCTQDECLKYYASHYAVAVPGATRIERDLLLALRLRLRDGKLDRAELLLPAQGFSRWYELERQQIVVDGDAVGRGAAVAFASEQLLRVVAGLPGATPEADYVLGPIVPPAVVPTGEQVDTTTTDPGQPPNRLELSAAPTPEPDMVFAPIEIGRGGGGQGEVMVMDPVAVPPAAQPARPAQPPEVAPGLTRAFTVGMLRVIVFAAGGSDLQPGYDGVVLERH